MLTLKGENSSNMELKKNRIWKLKGDSKQPQFYRTEDPLTNF